MKKSDLVIAVLLFFLIMHHIYDKVADTSYQPENTIKAITVEEQIQEITPQIETDQQIALFSIKEYTEGSLRCQKNEYNLPISCYDKNHTRISGIVKKYHKNGELFYEATFRHGLADGYIRTYHPNGNIASYTPYTQGKISGTVKRYTPEGKLEKETTSSLPNPFYFIDKILIK